MTKIEQLKELLSLLGDDPQTPGAASDKIGQYVIVRCRDAGVHAGVLTSATGRACSLTESRRLWYWKPANNATFLSGVAVHGLHSDSKIGEPVDIDLTENCEIIKCTAEAEASIRALKSHEG